MRTSRDRCFDWLRYRLIPWYTSLGLTRGTITLEVTGRKTGKLIRLSLTSVRRGGSRYLVALDPNSQWVKNVRAADGSAVLLSGERMPVRLVEIADREKPPILLGYVKQRAFTHSGEASARLFFGLGPKPDLEDMQRIASRYKVFLVQEAPKDQTDADSLRAGPNGEGRMAEQSFRQTLQSLGLNEEQIEDSVATARRFVDFLPSSGRGPSMETAWAFSRVLIETGKNSEASYMALVRYCRFIQDHEMLVAFMELIDGGEVGENLYRLVEERFGRAVRDEVFEGIGVPPYGTPSPEKPAYLQPVVRRLERRVGIEVCRELLSAGLRDLTDEYFLEERGKLRRAGDIDAYLHQRKEAFVAQLEGCLREGRLFYAQEITPEVVEFVRRDPEMGGGKREGEVIYETKIPYMTAKYLTETDPTLKRYYACHCPWARDAIRKGDVQLAETFCQCSGGFHKKPLEVALGRSLKVDVLESALRGDMRCRFAIHPADQEFKTNSD